MGAANAQQSSSAAGCSAATRAAVERLQREGNWEALVRSTSRTVSRAEAEDLVSRSFERALGGLCTAQHVPAVHAWIAQDIRFALSHHYQHERVVRNSLQVQGNALPRPGDRDDAETHVSQSANAELAAELLSDFSPRDQRILHLAWGEGEKRPAVAATLGVSERIVKRTLFNSGRRLEGRLVDRLGGGCGGEGERHVRSLAFNRAEASERAQAILHMRGCASCDELYGRLQEVRAGAAAFVPVPVAAGSGFLESGHGFVEGVVGWTREHVMRVHARVIELAASPGPMPRPGVVLANVGACAVAAGGSYCVTELPPIKAVSQGPAQVETRPAPPPPPQAGTPTGAPLPAPAPAASRSEAPASESSAADEQSGEQAEPAPQSEFEPQGEPISAPEPSPAPTSSPAPRGGAGGIEFP